MTKRKFFKRSDIVKVVSSNSLKLVYLLGETSIEEEGFSNGKTFYGIFARNLPVESFIDANWTVEHNPSEIPKGVIDIFRQEGLLPKGLTVLTLEEEN